VSCVHPSVPGFYTQHVSALFFKIQCPVSCDSSSIWIETEDEVSTCRAIKEGIGDLSINTLILICGSHLQHEGSPGHVFTEASFVNVLAEHWSIIIGVGDFDPDLGGTA
uniref:Uncharacterized protein n=1 Tax=Peromyscus maniculatus bairdii TaxID=230844 RepID=A0A8C8W3I5_PERMB